MHKYLQVEIKELWENDNKFEILDIDNDINNQTDRKKIWISTFSIDSSSLDNNKIWNNQWDIALLSENWVFNSDRIPNNTNNTQFTINCWDNNWDIKLIFGQAINKVLKWAQTSSQFEFWDSLKIWWNLIVNWEIESNWKNVDEYLDRIDTLEVKIKELELLISNHNHNWWNDDRRKTYWKFRQTSRRHHKNPWKSPPKRQNLYPL